MDSVHNSWTSGSCYIETTLMEEKALIYPGQTVCVMGLGVTGKAAVKYCLYKGARVRVSDARSQEKLFIDEGEFIEENRLEWEAGVHSYDFLGKSKVLLPSPGIDLRGELFTTLRQAGVTIAGELAVVAGLIDVPVIAVTGTNGKTTVTSLLGEVLKAGGKRVFVGGNIGTPLYEYCLRENEYDVVVAELSSFQLDCSGDFAPDIAILLNITPDHLDRHGTIAEYIRAKERIFANQNEGGLAIINGDDALCGEVTIPGNVEIEQFGSSDGCSLKLSDTQYSHVSGGFSAYNYSAAFGALRRLGLSTLEIKKGFQRFNHLPHRLEFVAEINGISFINDSKATNTGAVIGALGQLQNKVVLIAGGRGKGDDYRLLRKSVEEKVQALVLLGEAADEIQEKLADLATCKPALTMEEAVAQAYHLASSGESVLLSPACASFDMFSSYGNRGDVFKAAVMALVKQEQKKRGPASV